MATNEIHKYGHWLTIPVPVDLTPGSAYLFGGDTPCVIQVIHQAERPEIPGYEALPVMSGGNEDTSKIDPALIPDGGAPEDYVFASVAFLGVWAFEIEDDLAIGDEVGANADGTVSAGTGFGRVTNRGLDGRYHVRLAS